MRGQLNWVVLSKIYLYEFDKGLGVDFLLTFDGIFYNKVCTIEDHFLRELQCLRGEGEIPTEDD